MIRHAHFRAFHKEWNAYPFDELYKLLDEWQKKTGTADEDIISITEQYQQMSGASYGVEGPRDHERAVILNVWYRTGVRGN
jgi:hypothetical protein